MRTCCMHTHVNLPITAIPSCHFRSQVLVVGFCGFFQMSMFEASKLSVVERIDDVIFDTRCSYSARLKVLPNLVFATVLYSVSLLGMWRTKHRKRLQCVTSDPVIDW
jgi:hypothetical protein